jgi:hypothetical protein
MGNDVSPNARSLEMQPPSSTRGAASARSGYHIRSKCVADRRKHRSRHQRIVSEFLHPQRGKHGADKFVQCILFSQKWIVTFLSHLSASSYLPK